MMSQVEGPKDTQLGVLVTRCLSDFATVIKHHDQCSLKKEVILVNGSRGIRVHND